MTVLANPFFIPYIQKARLWLGFLFFVISCQPADKLITMQGLTMGTTYTVKYVNDVHTLNPQQLKSGIDSILSEINHQMSLWDSTSEISKFNAFHSMNPFPVSQEFYDVVLQSLSVSQETDGLFDITVYDLLKIWGFGPHPLNIMPEEKQISDVMQYTGYEHILAEEQTLTKNNPNTKIDLNAIAPGYSVDLVFEFLRNQGIQNVFVEIGGEIRCTGFNINQEKWTIGIEDPLPGSIAHPFAFNLSLGHSALATSGNYRNYVEIDGMKLGHTINPQTGKPVSTNVLSVSVLAPTCIYADAWATALMVMNFESGLKHVQQNDNLDAVWILQNNDGSRKIATSGIIISEETIYPWQSY